MEGIRCVISRVRFHRRFFFPSSHFLICFDIFFTKHLEKQPRCVVHTLSNLIQSSPQYTHPQQLIENLLANVTNIFLKSNPEACFNPSSCWTSEHCFSWSLVSQLLFDFSIFDSLLNAVTTSVLSLSHFSSCFICFLEIILFTTTSSAISIYFLFNLLPKPQSCVYY